MASNRWKNVSRDYTAEDVKKLSGSLRIEHTIADKGGKETMEFTKFEDYINTLGLTQVICCTAG